MLHDTYLKISHFSAWVNGNGDGVVMVVKYMGMGWGLKKNHGEEAWMWLIFATMSLFNGKLFHPKRAEYFCRHNCYVWAMPWLRYCDSTTIRLRRIARACFHSTRFDASKKRTSIFRRSRVVVVSQSNRNCDIGLKRRMSWSDLSSTDSTNRNCDHGLRLVTVRA